jgi:hypothetical protein
MGDLRELTLPASSRKPFGLASTQAPSFQSISLYMILLCGLPGAICSTNFRCTSASLLLTYFSTDDAFSFFIATSEQSERD